VASDSLAPFLSDKLVGIAKLNIFVGIYLYFIFNNLALE
jgi:hypothetical protein